MEIQRAVITAAATSQRRLPLQRLVDRNGVEKTALAIIVEEVIAAGVEEIGVVVCPGDQIAYAEAAGDYGRSLHFIEQPEPRGYGEALLRAARFVGDHPFLHLVSDHLYISGAEPRCAEQLVAAAQTEGCAVSAVQATREHMLPYYGTVGGRRVAGRTDLYEIDDVVEKPTPTEAEQRLIVPGLRAGHYLCLFGMHVLTPLVMEILAEQRATAGDGPLLLSPALALLARRERYLAMELKGARFNIGVRYGVLTAQMALALAGVDRDEVLTQLVEMLANRQLRG